MENNNYTEIVVNAEYLAIEFGVTMRTIQLWAKEDGLPKNIRDEYPLIGAYKWMLKRKDQTIKEISASDPEKIERLESAKLQNERRRNDLSKQRGDLLDREQVELAFISIIKMLIRNAKAIPPRLNKKLSGDTSTLTIINNEIEEFQTMCAETKLNLMEDDVEELNTPEE